MNVYLLIMVVLGGQNHPASITAEFNSRQACVVAASDLSAKMKEHISIGKHGIFWTCSPKG